MIVADQTEVAEFLQDPAHWPAGTDRVQRVDTHGSLVFLGGALALKLKRAVKFDYMDFSTLERRRRFCEAELRLNRRTAPALYRRIFPITREADGRLALAGGGKPVEWVLEMARFDQDTLFDRLAARGALTLPLIERLADAIADFHAGAERADDADAFAQLAGVIEGNRADMEGAHAAMLEQPLVRAVIGEQQARLSAIAALLRRRGGQGAVRRCHGDLHLRNICLIDGRPTLFDCIEFNDAFSVIDVLYDIAFLIMDLLHRDLPVLAGAVLSRYLAHDGDLSALPLLPLYLSVRATVRAKIAATMMETTADAAALERSRAEARQYLELAGGCLVARPARLVAVGGLSGSGKTTIARLLAPDLGNAPGALVLRSDEIRKCLLGRAPSESLPAEAYGPETGARVYAEIASRAGAALAAGQAVIADAVFARPEERAGIEQVAHDRGVPFDGIWLNVAPEIMAARIGSRHGDASDATPEVLARQLGYDIGALTWRRVEAGGEPADVAAAARLGLAGR